MRWAGQQIDRPDEESALPGLGHLQSLVRTVSTPEFAGISFHEVLARSALNRVPAASGVPFSWTINPYRGCSHGCVYCFARQTHTYLDLDAGQDFDRQIVVKINIVEVLQRELRRASWTHEPVALGTNTDPYQRAEGRYRLMPGIIDALTASGTPFSILTKGTTSRRDLPRLSRAAAEVGVSMAVSIALADDEVHAALEPGAPTPRARLELVRAIRQAGLPCQVLIAPVLPLITDRDEDLEKIIAAVADTGATGATVFALHLRTGAREWFWRYLEREHRPLLGQYAELYRGPYVLRSYASDLARRAAPILRRHGLGGRAGEPRPVDADRAGPGRRPAEPTLF